MRTAARRDGPERACIKEAERLGAQVFQVSGAGLLDTLVAYFGRLWWVEVKRPGKPLKPKQEETLMRLQRAGVPAFIVETPADMRALLDGKLTRWEPGSRPVEGAKKRKHRPGYDRPANTLDFCERDYCGRSKLPGLHFCAEHA